MKRIPGPTEDHEPFLSLTEAASLLKCHHNTVRAWVRQGKLEAIPMGAENVPMYRKRDVEALKRPLEKAGVILREDQHAFPVVGIGASAGGLDAISRLLFHLPTDLGLAYVVVQHLESEREFVLADLLRKKTAMPVVVIENGMRLDPDRVYVASATSHVSITNGTFTLRTPQEGSWPIDAFFTALASEYQNNAIGIVLSGTGTDGTLGLGAIHAEGGVAIVQDASALESSMPRNAQAADVVDLVLKPEDIGEELSRLVKQLYPGGSARIPSKQENEMRRILRYLYEQRGIDFTHYKEATIHRRIIRRMVLSKCRKLSDYSALLHGMPSEVDTLCNDMLINVTSFFRDPLFFQALELQVFPALLAGRVPNDPLRIWVAACAGGEEVVSIAIALMQHIGDRALPVPVQIFATDLNERTIEKARLGIYTKTSLQNLEPELLKKYFQHVDGHFQVIKTIRDMCVFAKHDLLRDPPFSKVDLISCQNMLIYVENSAQERVVRSFHYALRPAGFLALGKSESASVAGEIFDQPDRSFKVYTKKSNGVERLDPGVRFKPSAIGTQLATDTPPMQHSVTPSELDRDVEKLLLSRYMPASVLVTSTLGIERFRGNMAPYLSPVTGKASLNLLKMVHQDLVYELRQLLNKAKKEKGLTRKSAVPLRMDDGVKQVSLEVIPVGDQRAIHYLVVFKEDMQVAIPTATEGGKRKNVRDERERRIIQLEQELAEAREQMRTAAEEAEEHNQELEAANEEVVSSNEELQSINEELETSKEELQSINEEFATINEELQVRNDALAESEERYRKLINLMPVAVYTCDINGHIRLFNEAAVRLWGRTPVVGDTRWSGAANMRTAEGKNLPLDQSHMAISMREERAMADVEAIVVRPNGEQRSVLVNPTPLYDHKGQLTGAINVLVDITERMVVQQQLQGVTARLDLALDSAELGTWNIDGKVEDMNVDERFKAIFGWTGERITVSQAFSVLHPDDREPTRVAIEGATRPVDTLPYEVEYRVIHPDGSIHWVLAKGRSTFTDRSNGRDLVSFDGTVMDITTRKLAEEALRVSEERNHALVDNLPQLIYIGDLTGKGIWVNDRWAEFTGLTSEEVLAGKWIEAVHPEDAGPMLDSYSQRLAKEEDWEFTFRIKNKKGQYRWFLSRYIPLRGAQGEVLRWFGTNTDVTDIREASDRIRESEERFRLLADNMDQLAWMASPDGSTLWFNQRWEEFSGIPVDQIPAKAPTELHHPDHYQRVTESLRVAGEKGENWESTFPLKSKHGTWHWFLSRVMPHKNAEGRIVRWFGTSTDITEQREKEERLRESEERYRGLFTSMDQGFCVIELIFDEHGKAMDYRYLEMNSTFEKHTGLANAIGRTMRELVPDLEQHWFDAYGKVALTGESVSFEQGAVAMDRWFEVYAYRVDAVTQRVAVLFSDVTDRKRAAEELKASEERFRLLSDNIGQLAWVAEPDGSINWYNKRWFEFTGTTLDEMQGWGWQKIHHPDHVEHVTAKFKHHIENGIDWQDTFPIRSADGEYRWFLSRAFPVRDANGTILRWFGTNTDVTDIREAEERLRDSEANFRLLADNMDQLAMILDADGKPVWFNKRWQPILGVDFANLNSEERMTWMHPDDVERMLEMFDNGLSSEKAWDTTFRMRVKSGEYRWFLTRSVPVVDSDAQVVRWFTTNTDITEAKNAEQIVQDRQDRLLSAAEAAELGVFMWHIYNDETSWENDRMFAIFGRTREQGPLSAAAFADEFIHPEDLTSLREKVAVAIAEVGTFEHVFRIRRVGENGPRILQVTARVQQTNGKADRIVGVMADITVRETDAEAARRLATIITSTQDAVISKDLNGMITSWNQAATEVFGYTAEETIGRPVLILVPEEMYGEEAMILARLRKGERIEHYETVRKRKDGTRIEVALTVSPIINAQGVVIGASKVARNIGDRKRLEQDITTANAQLRMVTDHMPVAVARLGLDQRFLWASQGYLNWIGLPVDQVEGKLLRDVIGKDAHSVLLPYVEQVLKGEPVECEVHVEVPTRGSRWLDVKYAPLYEGENIATGWIEVITDITMGKGLESALRDADEQKDHFLATLAHELRNPLAPIKNGLYLLELSADDPETIQRTQAMMARQVEHMVRLVDDLMDLSRISRGKIELVLERVELERVIATAMEASEQLIQQRDHHLSLSLPKGRWEVRGDMVRLTQIVANLLNNAAKYTDPGGQIELRLEREGNEVAIHVNDNGIGIDASALPVVFDMFAQVSSAEKKVEGGLGIGLNIVKRLVEMHAGRIEARSAGLGHGSEFIVWLPLLEKIVAPTITHSKEAERVATLHARRVLIVDDNEDAAFSMSLLLKKRGHTVEVAHDGVQAVERVHSFRPQIIFMDIGMPRMNGYEACSAIRESAEGNDITIVALSGWGQQEDRNRAEKAGFDMHLVKPIDGATLLKVISENGVVS